MNVDINIWETWWLKHSENRALHTQLSFKNVYEGRISYDMALKNIKMNEVDGKAEGYKKLQTLYVLFLFHN